MAPKNTRVEIIQKLYKEINAGLTDPEIEAKLGELGGVPLAGSASKAAPENDQLRKSSTCFIGISSRRNPVGKHRPRLQHRN